MPKVNRRSPYHFDMSFYIEALADIKDDLEITRAGNAKRESIRGFDVPLGALSNRLVCCFSRNVRTLRGCLQKLRQRAN